MIEDIIYVKGSSLSIQYSVQVCNVRCCGGMTGIEDLRGLSHTIKQPAGCPVLYNIYYTRYT